MVGGVFVGCLWGVCGVFVGWSVEWSVAKIFETFLHFFCTMKQLHQQKQ